MVEVSFSFALPPRPFRAQLRQDRERKELRLTSTIQFEIPGDSSVSSSLLDVSSSTSNVSSEESSVNNHRILSGEDDSSRSGLGSVGREAFVVISGRGDGPARGEEREGGGGAKVSSSLNGSGMDLRTKW